MKVLHDKGTIQSIFHLSDIHIRLYHRLEDEYEHVFHQMYKLLEQSRDKGEACLIVLTGDILHHKNDLSPECILTTLRFLNTLSSYYPTLFIAGNHDTLLNNPHRTDSLSAILAENDNANLHYLKYSGWYRYADVVFGVSSLLDQKMVRAEEQENIPWKKVALYHGGVGRFSTNKGFVMEGIPMSTFDGYDMVMLGDIHLHQYLDKQKRIAYAGSMIAQNFGETDPDHGVLKWGVATGASSLIVLENPYRYCEAVLKEDRWLVMDGKTHDLDNVLLPEKGRLKVFVGQKTAQTLRALARLRSRYPSLQLHENVLPIPSCQQEELLRPTHGTDTIQLLDNYFSTLPADWQDLKEVVMAFFQDNLQSKTPCSASHFEILRLEFSYMFGYGPNIVVDFSQFPKHETIGIFGMNSAGKSTLIDVMLFLLYGNITRYKHSQTVPPEVIHFQQKTSSGMIRFRSHNILYEVQKKMTRSTNGKIKVEEKLFKVLHDGTRLDLSEEHRKKTDKFIISQIGTPSQFLFTNIFLQTNEQSFRSMAPKDRKDFLYDILGLSQLEEYYQQNLVQWKGNNILLEQLEKDLKTEGVRPEQLEEVRAQLSQWEEEKLVCENSLSALQKKIRKKLSLRQPCPLSAKELASQKKNTLGKVERLRQEASRLREQVASLGQSEAPSKHVDLEQARNQLWEAIELLHQKVQPLPTLDLSRFQLGGGADQPTVDDAVSFRREVYERFLEKVRPILEGVDEAGLTVRKEDLLSSLHPTPDPATDTATLQKELAQLPPTPDPTQELREWTEQLSVWEARLVALRDEWKDRWDEWDQLQKEPDMVRFMSGLRFNKKCSSCSHNGSVLGSCLEEAAGFRQQKEKLWEVISSSKEQQKQWEEEIVRARKKVVELQQRQCIFQQMSRLQHILGNRAIREKLCEVEAQRKLSQSKRAWEEAERVARQRQKVQEHNAEVEHEIQEKKQQVAILDRQRRLWDEAHAAQTQWKETTALLEKEQARLAELVQWEKNLEENERLDRWVQEKEEEEERLRLRLEKNRDGCLRKHQELGLLTEQAEARKKKEEQYNRLKKENSMLGRLLKVLHRDGLPMYLMEQYLLQLETRINELIRPFLKEKTIVLRKEQKKETANIVLSVSTLGSETLYLGGMEGFIVDASIKEVLAEVSLQCKSNLFLIDEGISALDKKNMENLDQFFQFLEERHPHVLIISHLSEAQHIVRHSLQVSKVDGYSKIVYV